MFITTQVTTLIVFFYIFCSILVIYYPVFCKPFFCALEFWAWSFRRPKASPSVGPYTLSVVSFGSCLPYRSRFSPSKHSNLQQSALLGHNFRSSSSYQNPSFSQVSGVLEVLSHSFLSSHSCARWSRQGFSFLTSLYTKSAGSSSFLTPGAVVPQFESVVLVVLLNR